MRVHGEKVEVLTESGLRLLGGYEIVGRDYTRSKTLPTTIKPPYSSRMDGYLGVWLVELADNCQPHHLLTLPKASLGQPQQG